MSEKLESEGQMDTSLDTGNVQVSDFSKELIDFLSDDKLINREEIGNVLKSNLDLKNGFEDFLSSANLRTKIKFKRELQTCSTEDEIKSVIVANIPEGYKLGNRDDRETGMLSENQQGNNEMMNGINLPNKEIEDSSNIDQAIDRVNMEIKGSMDLSEKNVEDSNNIEQSIERDNVEKGNIEAGVTGLAELNETIEKRNELIDKYENLNEKTNKDSENYKEIREQLERDGVLLQLQQSNHDENFIDNYIIVQTTLQELKSNPEDYDQSDISEFDMLVKSLNNACKIPDTNIKSFSEENVTETRQELFNADVGNKELIETKDESKNEHASEYEKLLTMDDKETISNYGKFITDPTIKDIWDKYEKGDEELTGDEKDQLTGMVDKIKLAMDEKTKDLVEELCIVSQIEGMSKCIGPKYEDKFEFNKAKEIKNNNGVIVIEGHVDGVDFYLRQDSKDSDARLQTSSSIFMEDNSYNIGNNFEDSPFILPTKDDVFNIAKQSISSGKALSEALTPAEYVKLLQQNIMRDMDGLYADTNLAHHYMEDKINQEKIADNTIGLLEDLSNSKIGGQIDDTNKKLFDFVNLMDFNARNSTVQEKKVLDDCITKIRELISEYGNSDKKPEEGKYPKILERYLTEDKVLNDTKNQIDNGLSGGDTLFGLFDFYKNSFDGRQDAESYMIDFASLEKDLSGAGEFSMNAQQREDNNYDADGNLDLQLSGL